MDVTMIGLQNAGKTSLLRVLAVGRFRSWHQPDSRSSRLSFADGPYSGWRVHDGVSSTKKT